MVYFRYPLSLCNVGGLLHGRVIEISHETVRFPVADVFRRLIRGGPVQRNTEWQNRQGFGCR